MQLTLVPLKQLVHEADQVLSNDCLDSDQVQRSHTVLKVQVFAPEEIRGPHDGHVFGCHACLRAVSSDGAQVPHQVLQRPIMSVRQLTNDSAQVFNFQSLWNNVVTGDGNFVRVVGLEGLDEAAVSVGEEGVRE